MFAIWSGRTKLQQRHIARDLTPRDHATQPGTVQRDHIEDTRVN
jgi:hypothetical protein